MDAVAPTVGVAVARADADGGLATVPVGPLQATTDIASAATIEPNTRTLAGDTHTTRRWPQAERMLRSKPRPWSLLTESQLSAASRS